MRRWSADEVYALLGPALEEHGATAVVLARPSSVPLLELLVARRTPGTLHAALDALPWRWRYGGDGFWRVVSRRSYVFDGGVILLAHRSLTGRTLRRGLGRFEAILRRSARGRTGLVELSLAHELVFAAVEASRSGLRGDAQHARLRSLLETTSADDARLVAAQAGIEDVVEAAISAAEARTTGPHPAATRVPARTPGRAASLQRTPARCRFWGMELLVGRQVFLPRGVSEELVRQTLARVPMDAAGALVDVGTGSGAAALALARERPSLTVLGIDTDRAATRWARRNANRLGVRVVFRVGSLLGPVPAEWAGHVRVVTANVPCLPRSAFEGAADAPEAAYVGEDQDGLGLQRRLASASRTVLSPGGYLMLQMSPPQWSTFADELAELGYEPEGPTGDDVAVVGAARWPG